MDDMCVSAPSRVDLSGGAADLFGGKTISAAIDLKAYCTISKNDTGLCLDDKGVPVPFASAQDSRFSLLKAILSYFDIDDAITVRMSTDVPRASGLGGSAAISVATVCALSQWYGWNLSRYQISEHAQRVETERLKLRNGYQDQYSSAFGGCVHMDFEGKSNRPIHEEPYGVVESLPFPYSVVVAHSGLAHNSGSANTPIYDKYMSGDADVRLSIGKLDILTRSLRRALIERDTDAVASSINSNQKIIRELGRSYPENEACVSSAMDSGALAAKVTGAGCGGSVMALCENECMARKVKKGLEDISSFVRICDICGGVAYGV